MELRPIHQEIEKENITSSDFLNRVDWNPSYYTGVLCKATTREEVRRKSTARTTSIFASFSNLRGILEYHEATIQKRWTKKTRIQRQAILLKAWPNMPTMHRPDLDAYKRKLTQSKQHKDSFIWPYINQEDLLARPKTLMLLLNSRGRHPPCDFAAADGDLLWLGMMTKALVPALLDFHVMVLNGATDPNEYGKLVAYADNPDAFEWLSSGKQFQEGVGLLILKAQERLLAFLVNCCKQILHDIPEANLTSDVFPTQPEPQLRTEAETTGSDSLAVMVAEAPYRVPAQLDLARIESFLAARASAAEDHMWALREDPGYFADTLRELKEHRGEMVKDTRGKAHPVLDKHYENIFWPRVIEDALADAYLPLEQYSELRRQAHEVRALETKHTAEISPTKGLPKEYLHAILKFRFYLNQAVKCHLDQLKHHFMASPPLRPFFVRQPSTDVISPYFWVRAKPKAFNKFRLNLVHLLRILAEDGKALDFMRMPMVVDELERLLASEPEGKHSISPYVAGVIGEISIIAQCHRQLEIYQPWANGFEFEMMDYREEIKKEFAVRTTPWAGMLSAISEGKLTPLATLGDISGGRFSYPVEKRRTKENVEILRQSEANLDAFWNRTDELVHANAGDLHGTATQHLLLQPRLLQRTSEWIEPTKEKPSSPSTDTEIDALSAPMSALYFGRAPSVPEKRDAIILPLPKTKPKTRGVAQPPSSAADDALETPVSVDPQPTFPVDARALKVFRAIFFNPVATSTPGEVPWNDFLHALFSTGFAAEKLYGSVWQFRPTALDVERSIQFHEPHPRGKIPFRVARRHGRRLHRAYGWHGDMFVLKR